MNLAKTQKLALQCLVLPLDNKNLSNLNLNQIFNRWLKMTNKMWWNLDWQMHGQNLPSFRRTGNKLRNPRRKSETAMDKIQFCHGDYLKNNKESSPNQIFLADGKTKPTNKKKK